MLLLIAAYTAVRAQHFAGELADLQRRALQELQRGQTLQSEQQRYQQALNIVAAKGTRNIELKPAQAAATGPATEDIPSVTAYWNPQMGLVLSADKIPQTPSGRVLQLWIVPQSGQPISAGVFQPNASGQILLVLPPPPAMNSAKSLEITEEPTAGSPQPTTSPEWSALLH